MGRQGNQYIRKYIPRERERGRESSTRSVTTKIKKKKANNKKMINLPNGNKNTKVTNEAKQRAQNPIK